MTPEEFIDALFGKGWTNDQLPIFLEVLKGFDRDSKRYHEIRDILANTNGFVATREQLSEIDDLVDEAARYAGPV